MREPGDMLDLAVREHQAGRLVEAEHLYRLALAHDPRNPEAFNLLGRLAYECSQNEVAEKLFCQALQQNPAFADAHNNLGIVVEALGRTKEAIPSFQHAIQLQPQFAEAWYNLGNAWRKLERFEEAIRCYERAIGLRPDYGKAYANLGIALAELLDFAAAIPAYQKAIDLHQASAEVHGNLGVALAQQLRISEALASLDRAIEFDPGFADAHVNRSVLWLLSGDMVRGWNEFEWRWQSQTLRDRSFSEPRWQGERLDGKTILLYAEQGFGDTLQFIRYAPVVKSYGGRVVAECQRGLVNLLSRCKGIDQLVARGDTLPAFDVQAPLMSLPGIVGTALASIPAEARYLEADASLCRQWHKRLASIKQFRVAINWQGRPGRGPFRLRDIPLEYFAQLAKIPGVRLISLQKVQERKQECDLLAKFGIMDFGDELDVAHGAFADSAAILRNVDLAITSDTSVAHLAGALGVPTFVALPFAPDWRWLLDRADTPWYPTLRLFRQLQPGNWITVFEQIEAEVRSMLG